MQALNGSSVMSEVYVMSRREAVDMNNPIIKRIKQNSPQADPGDGADPRDLLHAKHGIPMWKACEIYRLVATGLKGRCHTPANSRRPRITEDALDDWYYNDYLKQLGVGSRA